MTFVLGMATAAGLLWNYKTAQRIRDTYFTGGDR